MASLKHLYGLPSLRQTHRDIEVNAAYQFLGYSLLEKIPHFAAKPLVLLPSPSRLRQQNSS
ncbi:MAG: transposase [Oscillospiraceae bacterium]|nr:transposase [Oscillospiraceae bacterium]